MKKTPLLNNVFLIGISLKSNSFWVILTLILFFNSCLKNENPAPSLTAENTNLFTLTDSSETGFYFLNEMNETEALNIFTYLNLYNGSGVAVGDINNDSLPDIFMGGNLFGGRLYLNKGDFTFQQISETANVFHPGFTTGVTMADVNNDGFLDIYLCRSLQNDPEKRANLLLINNQDQTFTERGKAFGIDDQGYSSHANFFDMDNDGDLDLLVLNHRIDFEKQNVIIPHEKKLEKVSRASEADYIAYSNHLYRNEGNGTFTDVTRSAGLLDMVFSLSATVADINEDGWQDLFLACDFSDKDHFYINNGDGTFRDEIDNMFGHISRSSMGADIADINNDGLLDLLVVDMMAEDNYRQKQMGFGQLSYDMFHMAADFGLHYQVSRNCLQLNNGNGTFSEIAQLAGVSNTDWSWSPLIADFDNDGWKDIFITNGYPRDVTDSDFVKFLSDSLASHQKFDKSLAFNIAQSIGSTPLKNYIFQNSGKLQFKNKTETWGLTQPSFSNGAAYADLDLDGDLDLIINNYNEPAMLYKNNSRQLHSDHHFIKITPRSKPEGPAMLGSKVWVETAETVQFQELRTNRGFLSSGEASLHFGLGKENLIKKIKIIFPDGKQRILENVAADQSLVILYEEAKPDKTETVLAPKPLLKAVPDLLKNPFAHQESRFIDFKSEPLLSQKYSDRGPFLTVGDVNQDGLDDFYIGGSAGYPGVLYIQDNSGEFFNNNMVLFQKDAHYEDGQSVFFDADTDGDLDLYVTSGSNEQTDPDLFKNRLYLNDGAGNFTRSSGLLPALKHNTLSVQTIDFEGDGDLDLFVGGHVKEGAFPLCYPSYILINSHGKFEAEQVLPNEGKLGIINDVKSLDVNGDGRADLLLAGEWMDITLLVNKGLRFENQTAKYGLNHTSGMWYCLETLDVDQDGDLDFIAGNRGTNTYFRVSASQPASLLAKDFDQNGQLDAITGHYYPDGFLYPQHSLDDLLKQMVSFRKKFVNYQTYSNATFNGLFSKKDLKGAEKKALYTYESSVFYNNGEQEGFSRKALPAEAQFSHVKGLLVTDINEDEYMDLLLSGNSYGVNKYIGKDDASYGLCLRGSAQGFNPVSAKESGFFAPGDTRQVKVLRSINNSQIIVVSRNNGPLSFYTKPGNYITLKSSF